jgi:hypothetical protein
MYTTDDRCIRSKAHRLAALNLENSNDLILTACYSFVTSGLESREYGRRDTSRLPGGTLYPQKLALTSLTSARSVYFAPGLRP